MSEDTPELISLAELAEIISAAKAVYQPAQTNEKRTYANLYVNENTFLEWKALCDEQGINYGPRVSILMKEDIVALKILKQIKVLLQNKKLNIEI